MDLLHFDWHPLIYSHMEIYVVVMAQITARPVLKPPSIF